MHACRISGCCANTTVLQIPSGSSCGIVGRTGSGKSSLMLVLFDLIDITSGSVLLDGLDVRRVALDSLRRQISIIPQDPLLFSGAPPRAPAPRVQPPGSSPEGPAFIPRARAPRIFSFFCFWCHFLKNVSPSANSSLWKAHPLSVQQTIISRPSLPAVGRLGTDTNRRGRCISARRLRSCTSDVRTG